jgi:hypothetical protein
MFNKKYSDHSFKHNTGNSNLRYKSGRLLVTVRVRHYGRGDVRSRVKNV